MKKVMLMSAGMSMGTAAAAVLLALSSTAMAANVSVNIGEPGFYGRLDVGDMPHPQVFSSRPVVIENVRHAPAAPVYLRVPADYRAHWAAHCREYNACGERVLFVQDSWYSRQYVPHYHSMHDHHDDRRDEHHDDHR